MAAPLQIIKRQVFYMLTKGDFHIHSTASDGELSPAEIIAAAKAEGIDTIAITDHNTVNGINEAAEAGKKYGISVIPAIELSTRYKNEKVHILGYFRGTLYKDSTFQEILKLIKARKIKQVRSILRSFITTEASGNSLSALEGIKFLKTFGASVVLAHPARINQKYLPEILNLPFDGIEAKYSSNSCYDTFYFINMALSNFSYYTGGSDFHTNRKEGNTHSSIGQPYLNETEIKMFLKRSGAILLS
jgi:hypothetical protein